MTRHLSIGSLARATGVKVETIRYYERAGLLPPPARTGANYRTYADDDAARLRFIRRTRDHGIPLDRVRDLLALMGDGDRHCADVDRIAGEHLAEIDRKLADLAALRAELGQALAACQGGAVRDCLILGVFSARDGATGT